MNYSEIVGNEVEKWTGKKLSISELAAIMRMDNEARACFIRMLREAHRHGRNE